MNDSEAKPKARIRVQLPQVGSEPPDNREPAPPHSQPEPAFVGETYCKNHPRELARYLCSKCKRYYCELCVSIRPFHGGTAHWCRNCGIVCSPVVAAPVEEETKSFLRLVFGAFGYPFRGDGVFLTATGTVFILFLQLLSWVASFAALIGLLAVVILSVLGGGYLFSFIKSVVQTSAQGKDVLPDWPDATDFIQEMISPFFQCLVLLACCSGPGMILSAYGAFREDTVLEIGGQILAYVGLCYLPMALLAISMFESVAGINPMLVIPSIARTIGHYALVLVAFFILHGVAIALDLIFTELVSVPMLPAILDAFFTFYAVLVLARSVGLLFRVNEESLGWFKARNRG